MIMWLGHSCPSLLASSERFRSSRFPLGQQCPRYTVPSHAGESNAATHVHEPYHWRRLGHGPEALVAGPSSSPKEPRALPRPGGRSRGPAFLKVRSGERGGGTPLHRRTLGGRAGLVRRWALSPVQ